jgi:hypothetical protein
MSVVHLSDLDIATHILGGPRIINGGDAILIGSPGKQGADLLLPDHGRAELVQMPEAGGVAPGVVASGHERYRNEFGYGL